MKRRLETVRRCREATRTVFMPATWRARTANMCVPALIGRVALLDLAPPVLARALEPFPRPVRTLDALHLASMEFLRAQGVHTTLSSYDERMVIVARDLEFEILDL